MDDRLMNSSFLAEDSAVEQTLRPHALRDYVGQKTVKDSLEIYVEGNQIILKKYEPTCIFCENSRDIVTFKGKNVCPACLKELKGIKD